MAEMFPDLSEQLPPTVTPTNTSEPLPHTVTPTNTWNKVDQDIQQHTYNIHYDMITKLQSDVKDLSSKVLQFEEKIKLLEMTQRTHHTTTTNNAHVTAEKNAVVRYYASPPVQPVRRIKVKNPYLKKKKLTHTSGVPHSNLGTWPRK